MHAEVWTDYLCPWCYLALDRVDHLGRLGVTVEFRPFELHPEIPPGGMSFGSPGRPAAWRARVAAECAAAGLPFSPPAMIPNTRRALEAAEVVRSLAPAAFGPVHRGMFDAYFAGGRDIGDWDVIGEVIQSAGADASAVRGAVEAGSGGAAVDAGKEAALEHGIAATPGWLLDGRYVIAGAQPHAVFTQAVERLRGRPVPRPAG